MAAQQEAGRFLRWRLQRLLDRGHGADHAGTAIVIQPAEQGGDFAARPALEFGKRRAALGGQHQFVGAAVGFGGFSRHDLAALQRGQGAAEEAGIEAEGTDQIGRGAVFLLRDLVDDPRFLQREGTVQQLRLDDAEFVGIEPAKTPDGGNLAFQHGVG